MNYKDRNIALKIFYLYNILNFEYQIIKHKQLVSGLKHSMELPKVEQAFLKARDVPDFKTLKGY